jgi:hypothetical protein
MGGVGEEAGLLVVGEDGLCCGRRDREAIPSLPFRDAESPLRVPPGKSAKSRDDLRFAVREEPDEFRDGKRLWRQEEERFKQRLEVLRCGR